jgi:hypothetical protein
MQQIDPVVEGGVGVRLTDKDEIKAVQQGAPAKRLVAIKVIPQQGSSPTVPVKAKTVFEALA